MNNKLSLGGQFQIANCKTDNTLNFNSQKENIWVPIVKIKVREKHNLNSIKRIIEKKNPNIIVLESTHPSFNNKTINYSQYLISKGWKIIGTRILTKKVNKKYINMISFRFLSQFLTLAQPGETHPEKDVRQ